VEEMAAKVGELEAEKSKLKKKNEELREKLSKSDIELFDLKSSIVAK
jgi:hypothetical protein